MSSLCHIPKMMSHKKRCHRRRLIAAPLPLLMSSPCPSRSRIHLQINSTVSSITWGLGLLSRTTQDVNLSASKIISVRRNDNDESNLKLSVVRSLSPLEPHLLHLISHEYWRPQETDRDTDWSYNPTEIKIWDDDLRLYHTTKSEEDRETTSERL